MKQVQLDRHFTGYAVQLINNCLTITLEDSAFQAAEIKKLQYGDIRYGLYQYDHVSFILIAIENWKFDFELNAFELLTKIPQRQLANYTGQVSFRIVATRTHQLVIERVFQYNASFTELLKNALVSELENHKNVAQLRKKIIMLSDAFSIEEMFRETILYSHPKILHSIS